MVCGQGRAEVVEPPVGATRARGRMPGPSRFIDDQDAGAPEFKALREKGAQHPIEATGRDLRKLMAWVDSDRDQDYVEGSAAR